MTTCYYTVIVLNQPLSGRTRDREIVVRLPAAELPGNDSGQVVHTHVPLYVQFVV